MLNLDKHLRIDETVAKSANLCDRFSSVDLHRIGQYCKEGYQRDLESRYHWELRNEAGMNLAMQMVDKEKSFPWPNASNVAFPLVTIAALQFHSRAYPALIDGTDVVKCRVIGEDPDGQKKARAERIGRHMSYQCLEEDQAWEEGMDRLLLQVPIVGCAFKKTMHDESCQTNNGNPSRRIYTLKNTS